jgi:hypothetical protein
MRGYRAVPGYLHRQPGSMREFRQLSRVEIEGISAHGTGLT